jgi:hypothetical protein
VPVTEPEPDTEPPVTLTTPAEINPDSLTTRFPEVTLNSPPERVVVPELLKEPPCTVSPPLVMVVDPELFKLPPATVIPPALTVVLAKVTLPELMMIPPEEVRSLETFTSPDPLPFNAAATIGPPVILTELETGLLKLTVFGLTPAWSTVTVALFVKAALSPL